MATRIPYAAFALALALAACGGGSSSNPTNNPNPTNNRTEVTSGVLVDPYIEGGVLQELALPGRTFVQESSTTGANGAFTFAAPLTRGNLVALSVKGMHNGAPYTVRLERVVDVSTGALVVSPLTTLLAAGKTPAQVLGALDPALVASLTAADLTADPMAAAQAAPAGKGRQLLAASIAVGGALQLVGGNTGSADLAAAANAIGGPVLAALAQPGELSARASAGAAIADFVAKGATPATVGSVAAGFDAAVISSLVETAAGGLPVAVVADGAGGVAVAVNPGTVANRLSRGLAALQAGFRSHASDDYIVAANELSVAASLAGTDGTATPNDLDQARFFGGLARVALLAQPYSDGTSNGLNDLGDLLDAFGMSAARVDRATMEPTLVATCQQTVVYVSPYYSYADETCELRQIAATSPRAGQLQAFLAGRVKPALRQAVELLSAVTPTFTARLVDGPRVMDFDRTDALFLKGVAQAMIAMIELQAGYDLDVDLHAEQVRAATTSYQPGEFLANNPTFLRLADAVSVRASRTDALLAVDTFLAALAALRAEPAAAQANDLIRIADERCWYDYVQYLYTCVTEYNPAQQLADAEYALTTTRAIGLSTGSYTLDGGTPGDGSDDAVIDVSRFFAGIDLRALVPARFDLGPWGDHAGMFPDPTFGGVVVRWPAGSNPNTDLDGDGLPDYLGGYTRFGPWLRGNALYAGGGHLQFDSTGNGVSGWMDGGYYTGTYTYTANTLTVAYPGPTGPLGSTRTVITATRFHDGSVQTQLARYANATLLQQGPVEFFIWLTVDQSAKLLNAP